MIKHIIYRIGHWSPAFQQLQTATVGECWWHWPPSFSPGRSAAHSQWFVLKPQVHHQRQPASLQQVSHMPTMANQYGFVNHHFPC